jgi:Na+/H+ antiporter NhaD/arsenite permease-like protein
MWQFLSPEAAKWVTLVIFILVFAFILHRKIPIQYLSLSAAAILIGLGIISPGTAFLDNDNGVSWDVLAIYFGFGMLALVLEQSRLPGAIASWVLPRLRKEKYALLFLCVLAAFLSSFMANPVVVLMLAPLAIEMADRLKASLFLYLIALAAASNIVTTVTMMADPPALILAMQTNMSFMEFYWFQGRPGLGTLSTLGVLAAMLVLVFQFRRLDKTVDLQAPAVVVGKRSVILMVIGLIGCALAVGLKATGYTVPSVIVLTLFALFVALADTIYPETEDPGEGRMRLTLGSSAVFLLSCFALALVPNEVAAFLRWQGWVGFILGLLSLVMLRKRWFYGVKEFDWQSITFLIGIFIVIGSVNQVGLLKELTDWMTRVGLTNPIVVFVIITWMSVLLSAFIDNVPYTILMIPVCGYLAKTLNVNPFYLYFGMLIGTGIGGNLTPVGATANVLACGMLEKRGYKIDLWKYMKIAVPFSCIAVLVAMLLVQIFWYGS